jgi:hypothetical protein
VAAVLHLRRFPPANLSAWARRHGVRLNTASQALHGTTWRCLNRQVAPVPVDRSEANRRGAIAMHAKRRKLGKGS